MFKSILELIISYIHAGMPCVFHISTGYYCPGCGGTRAVIALLHGHFIRSFIYHPLPILMIPAVIYLVYVRIKKGSVEKSLFSVCIFAIVIIAANFIIKNAFLLAGIDLLAGI